MFRWHLGYLKKIWENAVQKPRARSIRSKDNKGKVKYVVGSLFEDGDFFGSLGIAQERIRGWWGNEQ